MRVLFIKTDVNSITPKQQHPGDAGYDLYSIEDVIVTKPTIVNVGIQIALPEGYYAEIHTRSSQGLRGIRNHLGIIDEGYRGEIGPILIPFEGKEVVIKKGDKIAQLLLRKRHEIEFFEVLNLPISKRDKKGFGSSGK
jgi:dUTP pyrophosphatase